MEPVSSPQTRPLNLGKDEIIMIYAPPVPPQNSLCLLRNAIFIQPNKSCLSG